MYNRAILAGRLVKDPELRYTQSGHPVASFTLAVDRPFAKEGGQKADFIDIVAWRKLAEIAAQYLSKGSPVLVEGRIEKRSYEAQDGQKRWVVEVVADGIRFLGGKKNGQQEKPEPAAEPQEEDVPF